MEPEKGGLPKESFYEQGSGRDLSQGPVYRSSEGVT